MSFSFSGIQNVLCARSAGSLSGTDSFLSMRASLTVRPTTMVCAAACAPGVTSQSRAGASPPCSGSFTLSALSAGTRRRREVLVSFFKTIFVFSFCLKQLNKGTFKEQGDKPYCHECFDRLFGWSVHGFKTFVLLFQTYVPLYIAFKFLNMYLTV